MTIETFTTKTAQPRQVDQFLQLAVELYPLSTRTQGDFELRQLLLGKHLLSKYFQMHAFLALGNGKCVARVCLFVYENPAETYFGFFEAVDETAGRAVLAEAESMAAMLERDRIRGPVNGSFWLGYRLRLANELTVPFTGEPWNQGWYSDFFQRNGYEVCERYASHRYAALAKVPDKIRQRKQRADKHGYRFVNPAKKNWDVLIGEIYTLLMKLYQDFPAFHPLTLAEFSLLFQPLRLVLDFSMVELAYKDDTLCAFLISLPNYGNRLSRKMTPANLFRILQLKRKAKEYILLYMGVDPEHAGLGQALLARQSERLMERQATSTAALIHRGKITGRYSADLIIGQTDYVLLRKRVKSR